MVRVLFTDLILTFGFDKMHVIIALSMILSIGLLLAKYYWTGGMLTLLTFLFAVPALMSTQEVLVKRATWIYTTTNYSSPFSGEVMCAGQLTRKPYIGGKSVGKSELVRACHYVGEYVK